MSGWIILIALNAACLAVNIINEQYWIIPLNILAIVMCSMNLKN